MKMTELKAEGKEPKWNPYDGDLYIKDLESEIFEENYKKNPEKHISGFKKAFGLGDFDIEIKHAMMNDRIKYMWLKKPRLKNRASTQSVKKQAL